MPLILFWLKLTENRSKWQESNPVSEFWLPNGGFGVFCVWGRHGMGLKVKGNSLLSPLLAQLELACKKAWVHRADTSWAGAMWLPASLTCQGGAPIYLGLSPTWPVSGVLAIRKQNKFSEQLWARNFQTELGAQSVYVENWPYPISRSAKLLPTSNAGIRGSFLPILSEKAK